MVALALLVFGVYVRRRYESVGVWSLSIFMVIWGLYFLLDSVVLVVLSSYGVTSAVELQGLVVPELVELFLLATSPISRLLLIVAVFAWLWFVIVYTTRLGSREKRILLIASAVFVLISAANAALGALMSLGYVDIPAGLRSDINEFTALLEVLATGGAIGAGVAQLYRASERHTLFTGRAVTGLSVAILLPYLTVYVYQFGLILDFQVREILQLGALSIGAFGLYVAVEQEDVFEQLPASNAVGRDTVFDEAETGIAVLDDHGRISDVNAAACRLFGVSAEDVVGETLQSLLPEVVDSGDVYEEGGYVIDFPESSTVVESSATVMADDQGAELGRTVIFTDITDERLRQQRIQVLNRVLRHNIRNELTPAVGYVDMLADPDLDGKREEYGDNVKHQLDKLSRLGDKAGQIETILNRDSTVEETTRLEEVVEEAVKSVDVPEDGPEVTVEVDSEVVSRVAPGLLKPVVEELVSNAVEHAEASEVKVYYDGDGRKLSVEDDGWGIDETELRVLKRGEETDLEHGSGLGLWLVKWGIDQFDGVLDFEVDPEGTRIDVVLPGDNVWRES